MFVENYVCENIVFLFDRSVYSGVAVVHSRSEGYARTGYSIPGRDGISPVPIAPLHRGHRVPCIAES